MNPYFQSLYASYYKKVYHTCLMILRNHHLAEEASQEAFLKAYEKLDSLNDHTKFGAWVAAIATNHCISLYKSNKKITSVDREEVLDWLDKNLIYDSVQNEVERKELSVEVKKAISKLNPSLKQLIILKYYWGLKEKEIAEYLGMPLGTVKSSLYRARKHLSKILPTINEDYGQLLKGEA